MSPAIVMTARAIRSLVEGHVDMTITALEFGVDFIELKANRHVPEIILVPTTVTGRTLIVEPGNLPAGRVTGATAELLMILAERPSRRGM